MHPVIKDSLSKSITYQEYRDLVADLLAQGKSTGEIQTEAYLNYSKLGNARMKRLDKTFKLSEKSIQRIQKTAKKFHWLVLTEGWCGDAGHALPILNKIAEVSQNIDLKVVLCDENDELMNLFLTNGGKSIPKLITIDAEANEVVNSWGPRPSIAAKMVNDYKEANGNLDAGFKEKLQVWYNTDKGKNIESDMVKLLELV